MNPIPVDSLGSSALQEEYDRYKKLRDYYDNHYDIVHHRIIGVKQWLDNMPWFLRFLNFRNSTLRLWEEECNGDLQAMDVCIDRMHEIKKAMKNC